MLATKRAELMAEMKAKMTAGLLVPSMVGTKVVPSVPSLAETKVSWMEKMKVDLLAPSLAGTRVSWMETMKVV